MANSEAKKGTKDGEEASVTLNLKTSVLRVSIHCEGCKRKVEKVLKKIQGIYKTEIDLKQQMVTVTGNIDADTLIKRLGKKGKKAELWPQKPQEPVKAKNKERKSDPNSPKEPQKERECVKTDAPDQDQSAKVNSEGSGKEASKEKATQDGEPATDGAGAETKEVRREGEGNGTASDGDRSAAEKQPVVGESEGGEEKSGSNGIAGKKKKKQGQNGKNAEGGEGARSGEAPASTGSGSEERKIHGQGPKPNAADCSRPRQQAGQHPAPPHSNDGPAGPRSQHEGEGQGSTVVSPDHAAPRHHEHRYRPQHHAPPAHAVSHNAVPPTIAVSYHAVNPSYTVSYHTGNPSTSYAASHYTPNPPPHSHAYVHPGMEEERPPYYSSAHHLQPDHTANPSTSYAASHYGPNPYAYVHPGTEEERPPNYLSAYHLPPPDSFEMFSDENPNACSIM
ncbi:heavy metal-associated isoprenylated plant protein 35-like [Rhodamnia argentea]|uniref:Heavy metal-associated isoprenylated plant protein 35-like n=1 Tax=Rhodamnia argentea TaxID=178133 RepID=A0A8B8QCE0_9MYRT|nr:heavy metal-associated isoprenylated plant protein 35-like [Rhodamnia argentea]